MFLMRHIITTVVFICTFLLIWLHLQHANVMMPTSQDINSQPHDINFNLKHIYNNQPYASKGRFDMDTINHDDIQIDAWGQSDVQTSLAIKGKMSKIQRLKERNPNIVESYIYHTLKFPEINTYDSIEWSIDEVLIPNITDPETILQLAKLASNAYAKLPIDPSWREVSDPESNFGKGFNVSDSFGWSEDGIRGHVFVEQFDDQSERAPLIIIAIKGTTAAGIGGGNGDDDGEGGKTGDDGRTIEMDKFNDNLLFSCCCARVSSLWSTVCDCYEKAYTCNQNCLENSLRHPDRYYKAVLEIYRNVIELYPDSEVWVTGHSLGGALSSLLGRTYGLPVVTFEAPGEMLASKRLHLPMPPGLPVDMEHIWHFGNNADPIFMGVCNGASSSCNIGGYAMESVCHSGMKCVYDTVGEMGWHVNIFNHRLKTVIDKLLMVSNETAECVKPPPCIDCYDWTFVDHSENKRRITTSKSKHTSSSTSFSTSSSTSSTTRKCIKWTWYGSCYKWSDEDDDDDDDQRKGKYWLKTTPVETTSNTLIARI